MDDRGGHRVHRDRVHCTGAPSPVDLPASRLIAATAHADAADHRMIRLSLLASGTAMAALGLTAEIAARSGQGIDELLDALARVAREQGDDQVLVVGAFSVPWPTEGTRAPPRSSERPSHATRGEFLSLLLNLADCCGTSIQALATEYGTPVEDTLADLEDALKGAASS
ncbi:hypothetical protein ACFWPV_30380 [Streptomyces uncialis]|uniref:hypothetical protein n=1 Tax=Streptomyces uncialis TaxID=1048205 RepID=UPI00365A97F7